MRVADTDGSAETLKSWIRKKGTTCSCNCYRPDTLGGEVEP